MIGRIYLITNWSFFSEFFQIDVIANGYMISRSFEDFVIIEVRFLQAKFFFDFIYLLDFFFIFRKKAILRWIIWNIFTILLLSSLFKSSMILSFFIPLSITLHLLILRTDCISSTFCHAHLKKSHVCGWLHSNGFYFVQECLVFLGYLIIRIVRIDLKIIDVFGLFSQLRFWMIDWVNSSFLEVYWRLSLAQSAISYRLRFFYVFYFFSTLLYIMFPKF